MKQDNLFKTLVIVFCTVFCLYVGRPALFPVAIALFAAIVLNPVVNFLDVKYLPRAAVSFLVTSSVVCTICAIIYACLAPAKEWIAKLEDVWPSVEHKIEFIKESVKDVQDATEKVKSITAMSEEKMNTVSINDNSDFYLTLLESASSTLSITMVTIVMTFLLLSAGNELLQAWLTSANGKGERLNLSELFNNIKTDVRKFLFVQSIANIILGLVVGVALFFLDVPNAFLWGALTSVLNFAPYIGSLTMAILLALVSLVSFESLTPVLVVPLVFLALSTLEGSFITPIFMGHHLRMNPVVIFIGVVFWSWAWGPFGALITVPLMVLLRGLVEFNREHSVLSKFFAAPQYENNVT